MTAAALTRAGFRRVSGSEVVELHRCPWRWHLHHVRRLTRREGEAKPGTVWGTAYHAAIAVLLLARVGFPVFALLTDEGTVDYSGSADNCAQAVGEWHRINPHAGVDAVTIVKMTPVMAATLALEARRIEPDDVLAWRKTTRVARDVCEEAARAAEEVDAWLHAAGWRVAVLPLGSDGASVPAIECLLGATFTVDALTFGGDGRSDALMRDPQGRLCLVDHKTVDRWPEKTGAALMGDEVGGGIDLRDDFQARNYLEILAAMGIHVERVLHLVRRATVPKPPPLAYAVTDKRHGPSRAKDVETTPDLYRAAVVACGKDPADYAVEIERAAFVRWQAWATVDVHPVARRRTLPIVAEAVSRMDAYAPRASEDVPRHPVAGKHPGSCARCPDRELCILEGRGEDSRLDAILEVEGRYIAATDRYPSDTHVDLGDPNDD